MRNLKSFKKFNEELEPSTYLSAADKLHKKGFSKRAEKLREFGEDKLKITIEMGDETVTLTSDNIVLVDPREILIVTDANLYKVLDSEDGEDLRPYFDKHKDMFNRVYDKNVTEFENLSQSELESFREFLELEIQGFISVSEGEYSGLILNSRKDARKLWGFIKQAGKLHGYDYDITVNDIPLANSK
jgi:hypothetical protein